MVVPVEIILQLFFDPRHSRPEGTDFEAKISGQTQSLRFKIAIL